MQESDIDPPTSMVALTNMKVLKEFQGEVMIRVRMNIRLFNDNFS